MVLIDGDVGGVGRVKVFRGASKPGRDEGPKVGLWFWLVEVG